MLLSGKTRLDDALAAGTARIDCGSAAALLAFFDRFDNLSLR